MSARQSFSNKWSWYQSLVHLSNDDITRFSEIENSNYATCFSKLIFDMEKSEVEEIEARQNMRQQ